MYMHYALHLYGIIPTFAWESLFLGGKWVEEGVHNSGDLHKESGMDYNYV